MGALVREAAPNRPPPRPTSAPLTPLREAHRGVRPPARVLPLPDAALPARAAAHEPVPVPRRSAAPLSKPDRQLGALQPSFSRESFGRAPGLHTTGVSANQPLGAARFRAIIDGW